MVRPNFSNVALPEHAIATRSFPIGDGSTGPGPSGGGGGGGVVGIGKAPAPSPPSARRSGGSRIGDHARGMPLSSRLCERRRLRRGGRAGSGSAGGCPRGCPPAAECVGATGTAAAFCLALSQKMQKLGHAQGMYSHASNSLPCPPTAGSVGGVFGSGGSAGDGVCPLGGQASARGCAARPACASASTTPGIPSDLRSKSSGHLNAGQLTPRFTKRGKIAARNASASAGSVLKLNLGVVAPEAAGAREAASS